jgi:hypothetical protein
VVASESLIALIEAAKELVADWDFGPVNGYPVEPRVFAANALHITLFKRRALTTPRVNHALGSINRYLCEENHTTTKSRQTRPGVTKRVTISKKNPLPELLRAAEGLWVSDEQPMLFSASRIVPSSADESGHAGSELAILLEDGSATKVPQLQHDLINDAADSRNASKLLPPQEVDDNPLEVPILRAPFRGRAEREEFIDALGPNLPVYGIGLEWIEYRDRLPIPKQHRQ